MMKGFGGHLFSTAAWHPEADGQSERTNQVVEIALRYFVTEFPDADWTQAIPHVQFILNSSKNASTTVSPFEYLYGFNPYSGFDLLRERDTLTANEYEALRLQHRDMAGEAVAFARTRQKFYYHKKHQSLRLRPGDEAFLRLHDGYRIAGHLNKKLDRQREGPVKVVEKIGRNAYRIELPPRMKIHDVITAHQLEPMPEGKDPYSRDFPPRREIQHDDAERDLQIIDYIIKRRINKQSGQADYLVKWKDEPHSHNTWLPTSSLSSAREMRNDFDADHPLSRLDLRLQKRIRARLSKKHAEDRQLDANIPGLEDPPPMIAAPPGSLIAEPPQSTDDDEERSLYIPRKRNPRLGDRLRARDIRYGQDESANSPEDDSTGVNNPQIPQATQDASTDNQDAPVETSTRRSARVAARAAAPQH
jgi:hypothetical protein